ncbi:MAG: hypothetical protein NT154_04765, partial [Verrucomicrobia bacterium]|nr:hypothetical protein [Verrucomicrobiota bacterium]
MASISCRLERQLDFFGRPSSLLQRLIPQLSTLNPQPLRRVCFPSTQFYARPPACTSPATARISLRLFLATDLVNWPRSSPETNGELSAGKLGSRIGVSNPWFAIHRVGFRSCFT